MKRKGSDHVQTNGERTMPGDVNIASVAAILADAARVNILLALSDGRSHAASELAHRARVTRSTASIHLARLVADGFIEVEKQGRYRYFRLINPAIGAALEALAVGAPPTVVHSLRESLVGDAVRKARICSDHLAGRLGVRLTQALLEKQVLTSLEDGYLLSERGSQWLRDFGVESALIERGQLCLVPRHPDWSEHSFHLAGTIGTLLMMRLFELEWIAHLPSSRAVRVTEQGQAGLRQVFGFQWE
jgi:DNA-binding transcriptional ArsR family regulator